MMGKPYSQKGKKKDSIMVEDNFFISSVVFVFSCNNTQKIHTS